ncbi:class I SAM-dependent methyltransferase [Paenibacillus sp. YYML68]|uniref:class I SAM-dependent methyltransferase n=1 Tax=Paenibacillus sp. YYML68 TaxID=2909250 RepID=UPI002493C694|nr:methylase [Paenibacillus sp. YYML68]
MNHEHRYEQIGVAMTCRGYEEYVRMFALEETELQTGAVLDVAGGASSFTADARARGCDVRAVDPLYAMEPQAIVEHGRREIESSTAKLDQLKEQFDWSYYGSIEQHREGRIASLDRFGAHYAASCTSEERIYIAAALPALPYPDETFSLVLVSHFLFLYDKQFDYEFHLKSLRELLRICRQDGEVRIYPVQTLLWERYPELDRLMSELTEEGFRCSLIPSQLPFIPGSVHIFQVRR